MRSTVLALPALLLAGLPLAAQWLNHPDPRTPRTKDGKPNLSAPAPRANNRPDLSGVWLAERTSREEYAAALGPEITAVEIDITDITKYSLNVFWGLKPEEEPLRPEAAQLLQRRLERPQDNPNALCLPISIPGASQVLAFKIVQTPQQIVVLHENGDPPRQIHLDGRALPKDPNPSWMGYSTARWQGDTLVVETNGITSRAWLDYLGHPRSESMRITERYRRRDFGHMDLEVSIEDPVYYTRPFGFKTQLTLIPDTDVLEYICGENERSREHMK